MSYGITGNNNGIGEYDHLGLISPVGTGFGSIGYNSTNIENADLGWEKLSEFNPGFDASFLGRRLNVSFDYYNRTSVDLLLNVPIPSVTGFGTALVNKGSVRNEGIEVELMSRNVNTRNFSWKTSVIASHNDNKLIDFAGADGLITSVDSKRPAEWIAQEGQPISSFYGFAGTAAKLAGAGLTTLVPILTKGGNYTPAFVIGAALAFIVIASVWILIPKIEPLKA